MLEITDLAVRSRAFQLADRDGYIWLPTQHHEKIKYQPVLDDEHRQQYLERARAELAARIGRISTAD